MIGTMLMPVTYLQLCCNDKFSSRRRKQSGYFYKLHGDRSSVLFIVMPEISVIVVKDDISSVLTLNGNI